MHNFLAIMHKKITPWLSRCVERRGETGELLHGDSRGGNGIRKRNRQTLALLCTLHGGVMHNPYMFKEGAGLENHAEGPRKTMHNFFFFSSFFSSFSPIAFLRASAYTNLHFGTQFSFLVLLDTFENILQFFDNSKDFLEI